MSSIIDNREDNTLLNRLRQMSEGGTELAGATAFFSLEALAMLAETLSGFERIRILFGDDSSPQQRARLLQMLRTRSDADLLPLRDSQPALSALRCVEALFAAGRVEARCYTARKFHAKAYLTTRPGYPGELAVLGSGNFTRPGLSQNVELNAELTGDQTAQLHDWYEARWSEAAEDVVTEDLLEEIRRQVVLYDPYILYLKALTLWGDAEAGPTGAAEPLGGILDPHQEQAYRQALRMMERTPGVMICDGVGLGKSFVALALMERMCAEGANVLLIAPRNILTTSWDGYPMRSPPCADTAPRCLPVASRLRSARRRRTGIRATGSRFGASSVDLTGSWRPALSATSW